LLSSKLKGGNVKHILFQQVVVVGRTVMCAVTPYFYYLFILSSLVTFCIFYLNNCDVWLWY